MQCSTVQYSTVKADCTVQYSKVQWAVKGKIRNRRVKSENGNGRNTVKIVHWNAGAKHWIRQRDEINAVISHTNPGILYISEANFYRGQPEYINFIPGYRIITSPTLEEHGYTRLLLLVRENLDFKRIKHLEDKDVATIWISPSAQGDQEADYWRSI